MPVKSSPNKELFNIPTQKDGVNSCECFLGDGGLDESNCPSPLSPGVQNAIANASTLAEVERLKGLLQSGQIPGRERRSGNSVLSLFPN